MFIYTHLFVVPQKSLCIICFLVHLFTFLVTGAKQVHFKVRSCRKVRAASNTGDSIFLVKCAKHGLIYSNGEICVCVNMYIIQYIISSLVAVCLKYKS